MSEHAQPSWARPPDFDSLNQYGWAWCSESTIDENFFNSFCGVFRNAFRLLSTLIVISVANVWFLAFVVPITWIYVKQTATSRSTTEAESAALAHCLIQECYPIWDLLELILGHKEPW